MASPAGADIDNPAAPAREHRIPRALSGSGPSRSRFWASAWWSFAAAVVARGASVLAFMICARVLDQARFGELAIIQSTVGMFGPFAGLGLGVTTTKYLAEFRVRDRSRAGRILALSLLTAIAAGGLMSLALVLLAPALAMRTLGAPQLQGSLRFAAGLLFLGVVEAVQTGALTGLEAFSRIAAVSLWNGLLSLPVTAALVYRYGIDGAIAGMTATLALNCLLNALVLRRECRRMSIPVSLRRSMSERGILLRFSLPSYLSGVIVAPIGWVANALLVHQRNGYSEMGLFSAAERWRFLLIFAPLAVSRIAVPQFTHFRSQGDRSGYRAIFRLNLAFGLAVTAVPALLCGLLAAPLMAMYGAGFRRGAPVLAILAFSAIPTVLNTQLGSVLLSANRAWTRAAVDFALAALFLGVGWWTVPRWGSVGLASSFAAAYSVASLILLLCVRRIHAES